MHRLRWLTPLSLLLLGACAWWMAGRRPEAPAPLVFDHDKHSFANITCDRCHTVVPGVEPASTFRPEESVCLGCHERQRDCGNCHPSGVVPEPNRRQAPFAHGAAWLERHGALSRGGSETCSACHAQTTCSRCHSAVAPTTPWRQIPDVVEAQAVHRGDFVSTHAIEARAEPDRCLRCHAPATCQGCHEAWGRIPGATDPRLRHPEGWLRPGHRDFHGRAARRQIQSCVVCHDRGPASNCVTCHMAGAGGGNPHPKGWRSRMGRVDPTADPTCRPCHTNG